MARLLAYLSASAGNTYPAIDMLLELERRGHEVHLRSRASDVGVYAAQGLCAAAIDPGIEQVGFDDWRGRSQVDSFMRMVRAYRACANLEIPDL
jgi:UDP:flavonoid glycosyltransferase YjiC (YdhE family)